LVLTAGHCVPRTGDLDQFNTITVTQGVLDLHAPNATIRSASFVYRAEDYSADSGVSANDWALLRLDDPINDVPPVQLARDQSLYASQLTALGWGKTSENGTDSPYLLKVDLDFIDDELCRTAGGLYSSAFVANQMICAGRWFEGGAGICKGDSGGPLLASSPTGESIQVGIASWGLGCGEPRKPGVFAEVQHARAKICEAAESADLQSWCPLTVTNPGYRETAVGTAVPHGSIQSTAEYGRPAYLWSVIGLPPGVKLFLPFNVWPFTNRRAEFIGTPTTAGSYTVIVTATDKSTPAVSSSETFTWNVL
jgi:secreted trypsin-like serine protease